MAVIPAQQLQVDINVKILDVENLERRRECILVVDVDGDGVLDLDVHGFE
jgi:hypothetical protein